MTLPAVAFVVSLSAVAWCLAAAVARRAVAVRRIGACGPVATPPRPSSSTSALRRSVVVLDERLRRRRRTPPSDADVARWCDGLARAVRSGDTLATSVRLVEPPGELGAHVAPVVLALDRGAALATAVTTAAGRSAGLDAAVAVVRACAVLGGPAAEPLDRVAASLRRRVADTAERRAQSAQARLSAIVLTVLPAAALGLMLATSDAVRTNVTTPAGAAAVATGTALNLAGWRWMRRLIAGVG